MKTEFILFGVLIICFNVAGRSKDNFNEQLAELLKEFDVLENHNSEDIPINKEKSVKHDRKNKDKTSKFGKDGDTEVEGNNGGFTLSNPPPCLSNKDQNYVLPDYPPCGPNQPEIVPSGYNSIISPGFFSKAYPNNIRCSWKITATVEHVVKAEVSDIYLENTIMCKCDSLQFWDLVDDKFVLLGNYCGEVEPMELIQSTGRDLYVCFVSDYNVNDGYFSIKWKFDAAEPPRALENDICGKPLQKPNISQKIVGGGPAIPYSWPWQVGLRKVDSQMYFCGGTLVSNDVVISAAHCFFERDKKTKVQPNDFLVFLGDNDYTINEGNLGKAVTARVKEIRIHKLYVLTSTTSYNDIAALILETPVEYNLNIIPACLPVENPSLNSLCYVTGWGDTKGEIIILDNRGCESTGQRAKLNQVRVPIVSQTVCSQSDHMGANVQRSHLCAGREEGGVDSCQGDSGGPLVCLNEYNNIWYLQGIVSYGEGCGLKRKPGVYTRTTEYLQWITDNTGVLP